jgi:hypothetical protein
MNKIIELLIFPSLYRLAHRALGHGLHGLLVLWLPRA